MSGIKNAIPGALPAVEIMMHQQQQQHDQFSERTDQIEKENVAPQDDARIEDADLNEIVDAEKLFCKWRPECERKIKMHRDAYLYYMRMGRLANFLSLVSNILAALCALITFVLSNVNAFSSNSANWSPYVNLALVSLTTLFAGTSALLSAICAVMQVQKNMVIQSNAHRTYTFVNSQIEMIQLSWGKNSVRKNRAAAGMLLKMTELADQTKYRIPFFVKYCCKRRYK